MSRTPADNTCRFPRSMRLSGSRQFLAVLRSRAVRPAGPLLVSMRPNGLEHNRLGLTVSRRVGKAVRRTRIKRLLREAFRLSQHDQPRPYDVVIRVRPHEPLTLEAYTDLLLDSMHKLEDRCRKLPTTPGPFEA